MFLSERMLENRWFYLLKAFMITIVGIPSTDTFDGFMVRYWNVFMSFLWSLIYQVLASGNDIACNRIRCKNTFLLSKLNFWYIEFNYLKEAKHPWHRKDHQLTLFLSKYSRCRKVRPILFRFYQTGDVKMIIPSRNL